MMVAPRGVCALATHPEQCTHVHDAETCVGEGQQDAPGKSLEIAAKPGADGGAEFSVQQATLRRTAVAQAASQASITSVL